MMLKNLQKSPSNEFASDKDDSLELQDRIFIMSQSGQLINTINLKDLGYHSRKWVAFYFTEDEDLFLISSNSEVLIFNPRSGQYIEDHEPFTILKLSEFLLLDSKFDQQTNMLVIRNQKCKFFWFKIASFSQKDQPDP